MASKVKPTDVTGRARQAQLDENAQAIQEKAESMSMATATAQIKLETEVIDATIPDRQTVIVDSTIEVGGSDATVVIRVIEDIENMTLGAGNNYTFRAGQKYSVTQQVATHLREKGYLAGVI
jgi:hypothetical protein